MPRALALMHPRRPAPARATPRPAELGDLLDAEQIRQRYFQGRVSREYVLDHVAPADKFYMGRVAVWYSAKVDAWWPTHLVDLQQRAQRRRRKANG